MIEKNYRVSRSPFGHKPLLASVFVMIAALYILAPWVSVPVFFRTPDTRSSHSSSLVSVIRKINTDSRADLTAFLKCRSCSQDRKSEESLEVVRSYPSRFSSALQHLTNINTRKKTFVSNLLPSILAHNEEVQNEREYLLMLKKIKDSGRALSSEQTQWLAELALKYKLRRVTLPELLKRVDIIPPSLALGQAVVETGWGGSLAAQRFNSPFGMMKTRKQVFSYSTLQESVSHYIHNLNTHEAYASLRSIRATLRHKGEGLCPLKLAEGLMHYSELRKRYTDRVKNIIKSFRLQQYDKARLTSFSQQS